MLHEVDALLQVKERRLQKKSTMEVPGLHRANQFDFEHGSENLRESEDAAGAGRPLDALPEVNRWEKNASLDDAVRRREMATHIVTTSVRYADDPFESMHTVDDLYQLSLDQTRDIKKD